MGLRCHLLTLSPLRQQRQLPSVPYVPFAFFMIELVTIVIELILILMRLLFYRTSGVSYTQVSNPVTIPSEQNLQPNVKGLKCRFSYDMALTSFQGATFSLVNFTVNYIEDDFAHQDVNFTVGIMLNTTDECFLVRASLVCCFLHMRSLHIVLQ
jgi:hypothetical protein